MSESQVTILPLFAMLLCASVQDLRNRRIRNWLTFSLILTGVGRALFAIGPLSPMQAILGMLAGASLPIILFALGALGGGDVKLLAGVGAWLGVSAAFEVFCAAAVLGMVVVLIQAAIQGRLRTLSRNSAVLVLNLAHLDQVGLDHTVATGRDSRSIEKPLPYAVPVLIAVALLVCGCLP